MSTRAFAGSQGGFETTYNTLVAATEVFRKEAFFPFADVGPAYAKEQIGIAGRKGRPYFPKKKAAFELAKHEATFEQTPWWLALAIKNVVTGVADGAGTGKIYAYTFPTTGPNTIKSATIEGYDAQQEYEAGGCFLSEFKISGKFDEAYMFEAKGEGRSVALSTKTGALTAPVVYPVLFNKSKLYLDEVGGTIGTTQQTFTFLGFELNVKTGWKFQPSGEGTLTGGFIKYIGHETTGKVIFEHDAFATAQISAFDAATPKLMRVISEGDALGTPGTAYTYKTMKIDLPINWDEMPAPSESDGNHVIEAGFSENYDLTAALGASITLVNERAAL